MPSRLLPLCVALAATTLLTVSASALPEGFETDASEGVRFHDMIDRAGQVRLPALLPGPGWALARLDNGFQCMPTAGVGETPSMAAGYYATGSSYEALGRPDRLIAAAPGAPTSPIHVLLEVNPPHNTDGFSHGLLTFDCDEGQLERRGLRFPGTLAGGRQVLVQVDDVENGVVHGPSLQLAQDGQIYARLQDVSESPAYPFAHTFNHIARWPLDTDAASPELLVSSEELMGRLLTEHERDVLAPQRGWSLRIQDFVPLADGSLWFVVSLNNSDGSRDVLPRSVLLRRDEAGAVEVIASATNPPVDAGIGSAQVAFRNLVRPVPDLPLLVVAPFGVVETVPPYFAIAAPSGRPVENLINAWSGVYALTDERTLAPVHFDPALADLDRDLISWAAEQELGTSDAAFDTDGDGFHDRLELTSGTLDARNPADGEVVPAPTRWGLSTRLQTAPYATPNLAAWDTTPYFAGSDPDGVLASPASRYTPDGEPSQIATAWALTDTLGVDTAGWVRGGVSSPFTARALEHAPAGFDAALTEGFVYLGPDDVNGAAFVHLPRAWGSPVFRLDPDGRLELLFDAGWYGLDPITFVMALPGHDALLATSGGAYGTAAPRRLVVLDNAYTPQLAGLELSPSNSRIVRFFGIGYGVGDVLEPFVGGYATDWVGELVEVDDVLRAGDVVSVPIRGASGEGSGVFIVREDLATFRWLAPDELLGLATGAALTALQERWLPLLERETPQPLPMFAVDSIGVADDASRICLAGAGQVWELELSGGRAIALTLPVASDAVTCGYDDRSLVVLRRSGAAVRVETADGELVASGALPNAESAPWRLVRLGDARARTWAVLYEGGAVCLGGAHVAQEGVVSAVSSPLDRDAAVWMRGDRLLAGTTQEFCAGTPSELVDRFSGDTDTWYGALSDSYTPLRSFWRDIARRRGESVQGPFVETLNVRAAELVVRPDGGVLAAVRSFRPGSVSEVLTNPLGGTPYFLGSFFPIDAARRGVAAHAPIRREFRGPRIGVPLPSRVAPEHAAFVFTGALALVPGGVPRGWGEVADLSYAGSERPGPYVPPDPDPEPDPDPDPDADAGPTPDPGPGPSPGTGCHAAPGAPHGVLALLPVVAWIATRRRSRQAFASRCWGRRSARPEPARASWPRRPWSPRG